MIKKYIYITINYKAKYLDNGCGENQEIFVYKLRFISHKLLWCFIVWLINSQQNNCSCSQGCSDWLLAARERGVRGWKYEQYDIFKLIVISCVRNMEFFKWNKSTHVSYYNSTSIRKRRNAFAWPLKVNYVYVKTLWSHECRVF